MTNSVAVTFVTMVCAAPSYAQPYLVGGHVDLVWTATEVLAHSSTPSGMSPGVVEVGEGVRFTLSAHLTPDIGTPVQLSSGQAATVVGWGSSWPVIRGTNQLGGTFDAVSAAEHFSVENELPGGPILWTAAVYANVLVNPSAPINAANPVTDLLAVTWTPSDYSARPVTFIFEDYPATEPAANFAVVSYESPPGHLVYRPAIVGGTHSGPQTVMLVPTPGTLGVAGVGAVAGARRRRRG